MVVEVVVVVVRGGLGWVGIGGRPEERVIEVLLKHGRHHGKRASRNYRQSRGARAGTLNKI